MHDLGPHALEPRALRAARHADERLGCRTRHAARDLEREQQLALAHAALARQQRARARAQDEARRAGLAPPRHAVGIAGEERAQQPLVAAAPAPPTPAQPATSSSRAAARTAGGASRIRSAADSTSESVVGVSPLTGGPPALGEHRARRRGARAAARREQDAREPRMHRQAVHRRAAAVRRPPLQAARAARAASIAAASGLGRRRLEPLERSRVAAPGQHVEHGDGEVHALDLRLAARPQAVALVPEPQHAARARAPGAAGALLRRVRGDPLELEPVEAARRGRSAAPCAARVSITSVTPSTVSEVSATFVARITLRSALGASAASCSSPRQAAVQRKHARRPRRRRAPPAARRISGAPGRKHSTWPPGRASTARTAAASDVRRRVADLDRVRPARDLDDRAAAEEARHRAGVERRRHHDEPQVGARPPRLAREAPAPGRRAGCARGTRRARSCGSPRAAGRTAGARVRMPSVATSSRVSVEKRRSKRTWKPTSSPSVQPCSSAIRRAIERAATRRGCSRNTGPSGVSAGGTRVVLPEPGGATSTAARARRQRVARRGHVRVDRKARGHAR